MTMTFYCDTFAEWDDMDPHFGALSFIEAQLVWMPGNYAFTFALFGFGVQVGAYE